MQEESRRQTVGTDGNRCAGGEHGKEILAGIDVGSTTTKIVAWDDAEKRSFSSYERHHADQLQSIIDRLNEFYDRFPGCRVRLCLTGSGASTAAELLGIPFVQEVTANAIALQSRYARVGTAIELGGQDAKMIFSARRMKTAFRAWRTCG